MRTWGAGDALSALGVVEQWQILVRNAREPFKDRETLLAAAREIVAQKSASRRVFFRSILYRLMAQRAAVDLVVKFFNEHQRDFMNDREIALLVAQYARNPEEERRGGSSKDAK